MTGHKSFMIKLLGDIEVRRGTDIVPLPPSKKTRALLAYLVATGRPHRREHLCSLLWDITDDPRGALRWSLSKLRPLVDDPDERRIVANRETVQFERGTAAVDVAEFRRRLAGGVDRTPTEDLRHAVALVRGEFLEGVELPDLHDFHVWCAAEREQIRLLHAQALAALVTRLESDLESALPFAKTLVHVDPLNEVARADLLRLLVATGRSQEAEEQYAAAMRLFAELESGHAAHLAHAWRDIRQHPAQAADLPAFRPPAEVPAGAPAEATVEPEAAPLPSLLPDLDRPLVGRSREWTALMSRLDATGAKRMAHVVLLTGEPGVGKSRLLAELSREVRELGGTVLRGCSYEAEAERPYGPWIDALREVSNFALGNVLSVALAPLLPGRAAESTEQVSRDRLFGAVVELIAARAHSAPPVLLTLDDVQWCDEASATLLHYVARMNRHRPLLVGLAARSGELHDNGPICRALRGLRRDQCLDEIALGPLTRDETLQLIADRLPATDGERVFVESGGNPLFALELARVLPYRSDETLVSLSELVRDRVDRLPPAVADVLRWSAVLGHAVPVRMLERVAPLLPNELMDALDLLERRDLLRPDREGRGQEVTYAFVHNVVRRVVYAELSEPRRRLMHGRVARALQEDQELNEATAAEIAHHAGRAGEVDLAAEACVKATQRCLRLFANAEAKALARRGMRYADQLREPQRTQRMLELLQAALAAQRPPQPAEAARTIEALAERALDHGCLEHARLGFHMLGYLRWEGGDWSEARRQMLRAEFVSRSADEREQVVGMAEAARCLALLEQDLGPAEAMVLEAAARAERLGIEPTAIPITLGMLRLHEGQLDEAAAHFQQGRAIAQRDRDRACEFQALEHLIMLELQRDRHAEAARLSAELVALGDKLREGSDAPFARALAALARLPTDDADADRSLTESIEALRGVDAKHRLAYALTRAAQADLRRGDAARAKERGEQALRAAMALSGPSEIAMAHAILLRVAAAQADTPGVKRHSADLDACLNRRLAHEARAAAQHALRDVTADPALSMPGGQH